MKGQEIKGKPINGFCIQRFMNNNLCGVKNLTTEKKCDTVLTKAQTNFLSYCKKLDYGKLEVTVKDGEPVLAVKKEELIKFD